MAIITVDPEPYNPLLAAGARLKAKREAFISAAQANVPSTPAGPASTEEPPTQVPELNQSQILPEWATRLLNAPEALAVEHMPVQGGPVMEAGDMISMPKSLPEAALMGAAAVIPGGKVLKAGKKALKIGTAALEGAAPETGVISRALAGASEEAPVVARELTGAEVLAEAANKKKVGFTAFRRKNPTAGEGMFEMNKPASEAQFDLDRYDPPLGVSERMADALASPKVRRRLKGYVEAGKDMMPDSWYRTGGLRDKFVEKLGEEEGQKQFRKFLEYVAASSPRAPVPDNIRMASYYDYLERNNLPLPDKPAKGYGSIAQELHIANAERFRSGGGLNPVQNPKPASFVENLSGNERPLTIDTHNFRAIGMAAEDPRFLETSVEIDRPLPNGKKVKDTIRPRQMYDEGQLTMKEALDHPAYWESAPNDNEYGAYERAQQRWAQQAGLRPAEWQEKMWVGAGKKTGLDSPPEPFLRTLAARIHYTAMRMKTTPDVVLDQFIRGKIPLLEVGGAAAGATWFAGQPGPDE